MDLKNQVCSLEFAKKLKKLGVSQHSHFKWTDWHNGVLTFGKPAENFRGEWHIVTMSVWHDETIVAAFTVAELGEMLPPYCKTHRNFSRYEVSFPDKTWKDGEAEFYDKNEADARAKMLIHLLENNLL